MKSLIELLKARRDMYSARVTEDTKNNIETHGGMAAAYKAAELDYVIGLLENRAKEWREDYEAYLLVEGLENGK